MLSPDLEQFLASGPAPVVFTLGTSAVGAAGTFYHESQKTAQILKARAILLIIRDPRNRPSVPLPEGIVAFEYAPFSKLFLWVAAVVHQGGIGTTAQALRSGRPQLVVPFTHDQPDNALRAKRLGAAETLYPRRYSATQAAKHLRLLLTEPRDAPSCQCQRLAEESAFS